MEPRTRVSPASWYELFGVGTLIAAFWIVELDRSVEFLGFGDPGDWDRAEAALLTALTLLIALPVFVRTRRLTSHVVYLEGLLRSRRGGGDPRAEVVARLGDGNLTVEWRFAVNSAVQSILRPERVGRIVAGQASRSGGSLREQYEIEQEGGSRFLADGEDLRHLPLCEGQPMRYVGARHDTEGRLTLEYRCPDCDGISETLL
jgi:hypothetical protein